MVGLDDVSVGGHSFATLGGVTHLEDVMTEASSSNLYASGGINRRQQQQHNARRQRRQRRRRRRLIGGGQQYPSIPHSSYNHHNRHNSLHTTEQTAAVSSTTTSATPQHQHQQHAQHSQHHQHSQHEQRQLHLQQQQRYFLDDDDDPTDDLVRRETRLLLWLKGLVLLLLIAAMVTVAALTNVKVRTTEQTKLEERFRDDAQRLLEALYHQQQTNQLYATTLTATLIQQQQQQQQPSQQANSSSNDTNSTGLNSNATNSTTTTNDFPNIYVPSYNLVAYSTARLSKGSSVWYSPLVTNDMQREFERFVQTRQTDIFGSMVDNRTAFQLQEGIYNLRAADQPPQPQEQLLSPVLQIYPNTPSRRRHVLLNQLSEPVRRHALVTMLQQRHSVLSEILNTTTESIIAGEEEEEEEETTTAAGGEMESNTNDNGMGPRSVFFTPVFRENSNNSDIVGSVAIEFQWTSVLSDVLQNENLPLVVTTQNTCGSQSYSLLVRGPNAFVGTKSGDSIIVVDTDGEQVIGINDDLTESSSLEEFLMYCRNQYSRFAPPENFVGLPTNAEAYQTCDATNTNNNNNDAPCFCLYTHTVYVTDEFESAFKSSDPVTFTLIICGIFLFAGVVFLLYDYLVERRQSLVLDKAVRSSAIVQSLFPAVVRDRLFNNRRDHDTRRRGSLDFSNSDHNRNAYNNNSQLANGVNNGANFIGAPKRLLTSFLKDAPKRESDVMIQDEPIAELFNDTTIMFADITGFTAWSSEREPTQVFQLLETLYQAFDDVALRLGVFKVETIGDCYVAVAGLPDPHKGHALIMVRFAYECMILMRRKTQDLEVTLGPGTSDLALRVGLHSGSVTAGVLRGDKARFQLFGDTMNTASRMESTGKKNMIQISEATAELVIQAGKDHWLKKRSEMVDCKGKGELQTFWVKPKRRKVVRNPEPPAAVLEDPVAVAPTSTNQKQHMDDQITPVLTKPTITAVGNEETTVPESPSSSERESQNVASGLAIVDDDDDDAESQAQMRHERLIDWNVEVLLALLIKVVKKREKSKSPRTVPTRFGSGRRTYASDDMSTASSRVSGDGSSVGAVVSRLNPLKSKWDDSRSMDRTKGLRRSKSSETGSLASRESTTGSHRRSASTTPTGHLQQHHRAYEVVQSVMKDCNSTTSSPHEFVDVIRLPGFKESQSVAAQITSNASSKGSISQRRELLRIQLRDFVICIASTYGDLPFHNFERASHAALSANKLINRLLTVLDDGLHKTSTSSYAYESDLHFSTFGISSDPLTQLAVVFAALVHDVGHTGVSNSQLVNEKAEIAIKYDNKSVAEKHSLEIALRILDQPNFTDLQEAIHATTEEKTRFRQLLINAVMATDIVDMELQMLRKERWSLAFAHDQIQPSQSANLSFIASDAEDVNRKATVVVEHIIQASDIAYTMQHWHVFCKWNQRLFEELYSVFLAGRSAHDPSEGWFERQLSFFDNYVIPLARNLKDCGVFGSSSDEYLTYALENRREWEMKGESVSREMLLRVRSVRPHRDARLPLSR